MIESCCGQLDCSMKWAGWKGKISLSQNTNVKYQQPLLPFIQLVRVPVLTPPPLPQSPFFSLCPLPSIRALSEIEYVAVRSPLGMDLHPIPIQEAGNALVIYLKLLVSIFDTKPQIFYAL
ncbi:hypothetical protein EVAR_8154_1 [Eumeta japonica]|uniref:Uncharacterized protein n=1 Tax=Eumeta variegata TaxID=151549 RepID=A0A4C1TSU9_EUMVA|nr:hypothetical protein EVAR_8154_1 [Eumeta japonica]